MLNVRPTRRYRDPKLAAQTGQLDRFSVIARILLTPSSFRGFFVRIAPSFTLLTSDSGRLEQRGGGGKHCHGASYAHSEGARIMDRAKPSLARPCSETFSLLPELPAVYMLYEEAQSRTARSIHRTAALQKHST